MNPEDAFYATVHDYPGGAESLAPRMGMSSAVLRNKADPRKDSNIIGLRDVDAVIDITGDCRVLQALAHKHGFLLVKAPDDTPACDMSVLEQITGLMVRCGAFGKEIYDSLSDGKLTKQELDRVHAAGKGVMTSVAEVEQRLDGMAG